MDQYLIILDNLITLNKLELLLLFIIILLLLNKIINIYRFANIIIKYIPIKYKDIINKYLNKGRYFNDKYINVLLRLSIFLLLLLILGNLFISY